MWFVQVFRAIYINGKIIRLSLTLKALIIEHGKAVNFINGYLYP